MPNTIMLGSRDLSSSQEFQFAQVIVHYPDLFSNFKYVPYA